MTCETVCRTTCNRACVENPTLLKLAPKPQSIAQHGLCATRFSLLPTCLTAHVNIRSPNTAPASSVGLCCVSAQSFVPIHKDLEPPTEVPLWHLLIEESPWSYSFPDLLLLDTQFDVILVEPFL